MAAVSNLLSLASLLFVISSLLLFIFKNLVTGGWTAAETQITPLRWISATVVPVIVVSWGHGGMATELALLYLLDIGSADLPVDFRNQYRASWLGMAVLGAMACCNGDTWASELGTVLGTSDPVLLTTFQKVPKGTNGGVTVIGLACSLVGGLVIGFAYWLGIVMSAASLDLALAPTQLLVILVGGLGGLLGSLLDSLIGASLQFSGRDSKTGQIVEVEREGVVPISGKMILDNHSVNLVSTILTALLVPKVALGLGL